MLMNTTLPEDAQYDTWNGFYRGESPTLNAFALLRHPNGEDICSLAVR